MASIRRKRGKWQVQVRLKDAQIWASDTERSLRLGNTPETSIDSTLISVDDLIRRYEVEVVSKKRCEGFENYLLDALLKTPLHKLKINNLQSGPFAQYRDLRLKSVGNDILRRELGILHHMFLVAILEWNICLKSNPLSSVKKPSIGKPRTRPLKDGELKYLFDAIEKSKSPNLKFIILFAIETAMRRGEIVKAKWENIDFKNKTLELIETKNGWSRTIPLSTAASSIIEGLPRTNELIFGTSASAIQQARQRLIKRAQIENLHFHDLRHEAISRLFEKGLSVPEVALISGHRDYRMLAVYIHLKAHQIVKKLG